jgi:predicted RND superfamily exporter protein
MWYRLAQWIIHRRVAILASLAAITIVMGYYASKVELSYEFSKAIPQDNPKYQEYQAFRAVFGDEGNRMVIGLEGGRLYDSAVFSEMAALSKRLRTTDGVVEVLSIPDAIRLQKNEALEKFEPIPIFSIPVQSQLSLDSQRALFETFPFYAGRLYNVNTGAALLSVGLDKLRINSKERTAIVEGVKKEIQAFQEKTGVAVHLSGLPFIRTTLADRIKAEMNLFLIGSLLLSALTLLLFFRSFSAMFISLVVVAIGVITSIGTMVLFGYKITILNALIPPLVVVIGVPNCVYFFNKYHSSFKETGDKEKAIVQMVGRMGIVTLFCNIAAAIGFAVFALTESALLKEFGAVAGLNIMGLFFISLLFIPAVLSYLPPPKQRHVRYLNNKWMLALLLRVERWTFQRAKIIYGVTAVVLVFAIMGVAQLRSVGYIVDDLPKQDPVYIDLKWFETHFGGVMPLEVVVDTKKKNGLLRNTKTLQAMDDFTKVVDAHPSTASPLSLLEALKFAKQSFYDGDPASYDLPYEGDLAFMGPYLSLKSSASNTTPKNSLQQVVAGFMDSTRSKARMSINMKDIGTEQLPLFLDTLRTEANQIFDTAQYKVTFTGSSVTFLEGSRFIIQGLTESIFWAFLLITLCMLYLFRSLKIVLISLIPNIIPLFVTAGVMGWAGIPLKPSTVLIFSVALGIVIDVTIRFLINYKQELPHYNYQVKRTLIQTIHHTGISIIYTSLVLIAGFIIFALSDFGGTQALGWLTSLTLIIGTLTNLVLLPVLLAGMAKTGYKRS